MFDYEKKLNELYDTGNAITVENDPKYFKLPIEYIEHGEINDVIKGDLEMTSEHNIYKHIINDSILLDKWSSYYTGNKSFLKDTQQHIRKYPLTPSSEPMFTEYKTFKEESNFIDRYQYVGIKYFKSCNNSSLFLHCLGLFNLSSPVLSLISPLFILIIPFVILKIRGIPITINLYVSFLTELIKKNGFYKMLTNFGSVSAQQKMSSVISLLFYIFQVYSNVISCITFYKNIHSISTFLKNYKNHLENSIRVMNKIQLSISPYSSYTPFYNEIENHKNKIDSLLRRFSILLESTTTFAKLTQLGTIMSLYYDIYFSESFHLTFMYSIYLNQYDKDLMELNTKVKEKYLQKCKFSSMTKMRNMYYLPHIKLNPIKNDINLDKNIIITGPNASGKTTTLKAVLINILMSQQFGYGCYSSAKIKLYDTFHSYLNIPDTSGRDSLFQAEARRCKDILECITNNPDKNHFCIFDEIYSGTNPNDAVLCANLYLKGMNHFKKSVDYILTTHYIQLCENFDKEPLVKNLKMEVNVSEDKIDYLYSILPGISYVHGGKHILKEMNYPKYLFQL